MIVNPLHQVCDQEEVGSEELRDWLVSLPKELLPFDEPYHQSLD